jgi:hypothetical protein|tara:strand:- start:134 stop:286 length:153 start_codon:yes stop_codon:yes gene_type:complete
MVPDFGAFINLASTWHQLGINFGLNLAPQPETAARRIQRPIAKKPRVSIK